MFRTKKQFSHNDDPLCYCFSYYDFLDCDIYSLNFTPQSRHRYVIFVIYSKRPILNQNR